MEAHKLYDDRTGPTWLAPGGSGRPGATGPRDFEHTLPEGAEEPEDEAYGRRLLTALDRFEAPLELLRWGGRQAIRLASRDELIALFKHRHESIPAELEAGIRSQTPEALAFRLAGDPRLLRVIELLATQ